MTSFFDKIALEIGITKENNLVECYDPEAEFPANKLGKTEIWRETNQGDIEITYLTIDRNLIAYYKDTSTGKKMYFKRLRYAPEKAKTKGHKYVSPQGQGTHPFFPTKILHAYEKSEKIKTLFITEGEKKAWKAAEMYGLDVVAIAGTNCYQDHSKEIHLGILQLIEKCEVEEVVILWDGDCLNISETDLYMKRDLTRRPYLSFFRPAQQIRGKLLERFDHLKIYFSHVRPEAFNDNPKGLDDLLLSAEESELPGEVIQAAKSLKDSRYFYFLDITHTVEKLKQHFGLHDVEAFYRMHANKIGGDLWHWKKDLYQYSNEDEGRLELIKPGWAQDVRWIEDEFFVEVEKPSARGTQRQLDKRSKQTMQDLYGKRFLRYLDHYQGFCNVPDHFRYKQEIELNGHKFWNRYAPFQHQAKEGNIDLIIGFIKHIFGESEIRHETTGKTYKSWEMGLDYIQLLLMQPTQRLPILCLYSAENATGKSTFGDLLAYIFGHNVVHIGNAELQSDFNEVYADKLLAICEEADLERKRNADKLKATTTALQIVVNPKGQRQFQIDFFCKFIFNSNTLRMLYMTRHDERYWVLTVPKPKKDIPHLLERMKEQVPAFLHFLKNRKLATEEESRMWFHRSLIRTDTFDEVVEVNEPADVTDLRESIKEMFLQLPDDVTEIKMPLKNIQEEFFTRNVSQRWLKEVLTLHLQVDLCRNEEGESILERSSYKRADFHGGQYEVQTIHTRGRHYVFKREDFVKEVVVNADQASDNGQQTAQQIREEFIPQGWDNKAPF